MNSLFLKDFTKETLGEFMEFSNLEGPKTIYLFTYGGMFFICNIICDIINQSPEDYTIKLTEACQSAGLYLLLSSKCKVQDVGEDKWNNCQYMWHNAVSNGPYNKEDILGRIEEDNVVYKYLSPVLTEEDKNRWEKFYKNVKRFPRFYGNKTCDIFLNYKQVKQLLGDRMV